MYVAKKQMLVEQRKHENRVALGSKALYVLHVVKLPKPPKSMNIQTQPKKPRPKKIVELHEVCMDVMITCKCSQWHGSVSEPVRHAEMFSYLGAATRGEMPRRGRSLSVVAVLAARWCNGRPSALS